MTECCEPGCETVLSKTAIRCLRHHAAYMNQQRHQYRKSREKTPFKEWVLTADLPEDLAHLADFMREDRHWPEVDSFYDIRKYLIQYAVPRTVEVRMMQLWTLYTDVVYPSTVDKNKRCADCGGPRSPRSKQWCKQCCGRHASVRFPAVAKASAMTRGEKRREDKRLADKYRDLAKNMGWDIEEIVAGVEYAAQMRQVH